MARTLATGSGASSSAVPPSTIRARHPRAADIASEFDSEGVSANQDLVQFWYSDLKRVVFIEEKIVPRAGLEPAHP